LIKKITKIKSGKKQTFNSDEHLNMLAKCGRRVKNGKEGQKGKEEAKEIGFLKLDTSASGQRGA